MARPIYGWFPMGKKVQCYNDDSRLSPFLEPPYLKVIFSHRREDGQPLLHRLAQLVTGWALRSPGSRLVAYPINTLITKQLRDDPSCIILYHPCDIVTLIPSTNFYVMWSIHHYHSPMLLIIYPLDLLQTIITRTLQTGTSQCLSNPLSMAISNRKLQQITISATQ